MKKIIILGLMSVGLAACGGGGGGGASIELSNPQLPDQNTQEPTLIYKDKARQDIVNAHDDGVTGAGVTIAIVDNFDHDTGTGNTHGGHIRSVIDFVAPDANTVNVNLASGELINFGDLTSYQHDHTIYSCGTVRRVSTDPDFDYAVCQQEAVDAGWFVPVSTPVYRWNPTAEGNLVRSANVVNHSYGDYGASLSAINGMVSQIVNPIDNGQVHVVAAGNGAREGMDCASVSTCSDVAYAYVTAAGTRTIVVGAVSDDGTQLEDYSTQAGVLMNNYIVAPVANDENHRGTSYAAPVVAGTVALVMDKFDNTDAENAVMIILTTADDLGEAGIDRVYGNGRLNVERALSPVGTVR